MYFLQSALSNVQGLKSQAERVVLEYFLVASLSHLIIHYTINTINKSFLPLSEIKVKKKKTKEYHRIVMFKTFSKEEKNYLKPLNYLPLIENRRHSQTSVDLGWLCSRGKSSSAGCPLKPLFSVTLPA